MTCVFSSKRDAAIWGVPGYTFKGIYKELQKHLGTSVQNYIIAARTAQGFEDWQAATGAERRDIISRWHNVQVDSIQHKKLQYRGLHSPQGLPRSKQPKSTRPTQHIQGPLLEDGTVNRTNHTYTTVAAPLSTVDLDDPGMEEAIQASVAATSQGSVEEDELIEHAIRASVRELYKAPDQDNSNEIMERAVHASVAEANLAEHYEYTYRQQLEEALRQSLQESASTRHI